MCVCKQALCLTLLSCVCFAVEHEISVMRKLDNPYCIKLIEVIEDSKAVHLVEEL